MRGGPSGRGRESLALPGDEALSPEPARRKQPRQSIQASNQAHLVWKAGCNKSVPSRPILKCIRSCVCNGLVCCKASVKACGVSALGEAQWIG